MSWVVRGPDGDVPFDTHDEAVAYEESLKARDDRTPDEVWASAVRPRVSRGTFDRRLAMGWDTDRALYTTPDGRYAGPTIAGQSQVRLVEQLGGRDAVMHEMLGRSRTIPQWSLTSGVSEDSIRHGIKRYGSLQAYFLNIGWYPSKPRPLDLDPE